MISHYHTPIKYGFDPKKPPPVPVLGKGGKFSPSFDNRLWIFHRSWEPDGTDVDVKATLMIVHGTVDHSGVYDEFAKTLVDAGIAVFAIDMRGWGLSDGESMFFSDMDTFVADVEALYKEIHEHTKYAKVKSRFLAGKSLGGIVTAFSVAKHPDYFTGLLGLSGAYELDPKLAPKSFVEVFLKGLNTVVPKMPLKPVFDPKLIVSDSIALQEWKDDPLCCKDKIRVAYIVELVRCCKLLSSEVLHTLNIPMLMVIGTEDHVVPQSGAQRMVDNSLNEDTTFKAYDGGYHNLLAEPKLKVQVTKDIRDWIMKRCISAS
mmetsp:Transcript_22806/g.35189  ORF Transcript_22806/g.35189 Transcript_22806/m.35189 type:complete len:317 (-) Transcript_22806:117-1067(-)